MNKVIAYKDLPNLITKLKTDKKVLAGGCFDILHLGHVRFLKAAKTHGTVIVALESDENLKRYKGLNRPIHKQAERAEILATLETVDYVLLLPPFSNDWDYYKLTTAVSPQIICVTAGDPLLKNKTAQAKDVGAKIVVIPKIASPSTSQLIKLLNLESI